MMIALAGFGAGMLHVLSGPDHLAAVAPYAAEEKVRAWRTGVRWGIGHSAGVLLVGACALLLKDRLALEPISVWGERFVGVMLIAIGIWALRKTLAARRDELDRGASYQPLHGTVAVGVGTVHGLAGGSHVLGIVPALLLPSTEAGAAYLIFFGIGTIASMACFSFAVGSIAAHPIAQGASRRKAVLVLCSALAMVVGAFWLASAVAVPTPTASISATT